MNIGSKFTDILIDNKHPAMLKSTYREELIIMSSVVSAITKTIPISKFNRGLAGQIFTDVKASGPKVVMRNNSAEAVIMPPNEYVEMEEAMNDYLLLTMAVERMANYNPDTLISEKEMDQHLNITPDDLDDIDEVEFE